MSNSITALQIKSVPQAALANGMQILAAPGVLYGISGYNSGGAQFLQLHDVAAAPADAVVPALNIAIAAASNYSIDFGVYGMNFLAGIYVCNSSTAPAKTIGAADCQFFARAVPT